MGLGLLVLRSLFAINVFLVLAAHSVFRAFRGLEWF